jgi:hypothetical protein
MYEWRAFAEDQNPIPLFQIDRKFIEDHMNDRDTKKFTDIDYRIAITEAGVEYMKRNCSPEIF